MYRSGSRDLRHPCTSEIIFEKIYDDALLIVSFYILFIYFHRSYIFYFGKKIRQTPIVTGSLAVRSMSHIAANCNCVFHYSMTLSDRIAKFAGGVRRAELVRILAVHASIQRGVARLVRRSASPSSRYAKRDCSEPPVEYRYLPRRE